MLESFILLLPCYVCLCWTLVLLFRHGKSVPQRIFIEIALLSSLYYYADANYFTSEADYKILPVIDTIATYSAMALFPAVLYYFDKLCGKKRNLLFCTFLFILPFLVGTGLMITYHKMGPIASGYLIAYDQAGGHPEGFDDQIYYLRDFFSIDLFISSSLIWILGILITLVIFLMRNDFHFGDVYKFLFKGRASSHINIMAVFFIVFFLISSARIALGRNWLMNHEVASCILSFLSAILMLVLFYIGVCFEGVKPTLRNLLYAETLRTIEKDKFHNILITDEISEIYKQREGKGLPERFEEYMKEKPYLDQDLSIEQVSKELHSNRTYVSAMLRDKYEMTFREYIGLKRIEEAKRMMLENPEAILGAIALSCGYSSDSQMIKKFNEIVGESPRNWLKNNRDDAS